MPDLVLLAVCVEAHIDRGGELTLRGFRTVCTLGELGLLRAVATFAVSSTDGPYEASFQLLDGAHRIVAHTRWLGIELHGNLGHVVVDGLPTPEVTGSLRVGIAYRRLGSNDDVDGESTWPLRLQMH